MVVTSGAIALLPRRDKFWCQELTFWEPIRTDMKGGETPTWPSTDHRPSPFASENIPFSSSLDSPDCQVPGPGLSAARSRWIQITPERLVAVSSGLWVEADPDDENVEKVTDAAALVPQSRVVDCGAGGLLDVAHGEEAEVDRGLQLASRADISLFVAVCRHAPTLMGNFCRRP